MPDNDRLRDALAAIASAATDALGALDAEPEVVVVEVEPAVDYHANDLERIAAEADADAEVAAAVIAAEAEAAVAIIAAEAEAEVEVIEALAEAGAIGGDDQGDEVEGGDVVDDAADEVVDLADDALDVAESIIDADGPPPVEVDVRPAETHWWTRRRSLRLFK